MQTHAGLKPLLFGRIRWLLSFEENDAKNIRSDVYQANASIIRAFFLVLLREKKEKNSLIPDTWDSLDSPH